MAEKEKSVNTNAYAEYMQNPKAFIVRKWVHELLQENYAPHDQIVERVASALVTNKDLEDFGKLLSMTYQSGYSKAFNAFKKHADKMGIVFKAPDQEKSGE